MLSQGPLSESESGSRIRNFRLVFETMLWSYKLLNIDRQHGDKVSQRNPIYPTPSSTLNFQVAGLQGFAKPSVWKVGKIGGVAGNRTRVSCCHGKCSNHWAIKPRQINSETLLYWFVRCFLKGPLSESESGSRISKIKGISRISGIPRISLISRISVIASISGIYIYGITI